MAEERGEAAADVESAGSDRPDRAPSDTPGGLGAEAAATAERVEEIEQVLEQLAAREGFGLGAPGMPAPAPGTPAAGGQDEGDFEPVFDDAFIRARRAQRRAQVADVRAVTVDDEEVDDLAAPDDGLTEEILDARTAWRGSFLRAEDLTVRLPNGKLGQRDVLRHPGAVAVIALTDDGKLVLVHQYRCALEQVTLEIPAGKLEVGEEPQQAAARELVEETGYAAARMAYLGPIAPAAGYSDEVLHLFMAMGLTFVGACPDADEFIHVDLVDLDDMVDAVLDGKVIDSKTVVGVLLCDAISRRMEA